MKKTLAAALMLIWMAFFLTEFGGWREPPATEPIPLEPLIVLPPPSSESLPLPPPQPEPESEPETDSTPVPATDPETDPISVPTPDSPAENVNPLTGLPLDPSAVQRRPVAVVFNNFRKAQPQLGIGRADIIWEVPAEGGITRMVGLFQSVEGVEKLGSIRSARSYVLEIALGYDALLVHAGGSPEAYQEIPAWGVDNMDGVRGKSDAAIFWRDAGRKQSMGYEHSLLTSGEKILDYLARGRYRTERNSVPALAFTQNGTPPAGRTAESVEATFNDGKTTSFAYQDDSGKYLVSQYGHAYTDGNSGKQVGVENLLVLRTTVRQIPGDDAGRLQVDTVGEDEGLFFCGGKYVPVRWSRENRNMPFIFTLQDGTPLLLQRGNSYICVLGHNDNLTILPEG